MRDLLQGAMLVALLLLYEEGARELMVAEAYASPLFVYGYCTRVPAAQSCVLLRIM